LDLTGESALMDICGELALIGESALIGDSALTSAE